MFKRTRKKCNNTKRHGHNDTKKHMQKKLPRNAHKSGPLVKRKNSPESSMTKQSLRANAAVRINITERTDTWKVKNTNNLWKQNN